MSKSKITNRIFLILVVISITLLSLIFFQVRANSKKVQEIFSPLPFLSDTFSDAKSSYWTPKIDRVYDTGIKKPEVTASSAISYDLTDNKLLYEKNMKKRLPIASLTKIMTAIVALENEKTDKKIKITKNALVGEDSMGLTENEVLNINELLYGLILHSGNDAAEAIAAASKVGRDNFVYLMNKKAEDLGLSDTHFTNPSGLEGDGNQYSTAYDLLVISKYGLKSSDFQRIVSTVEYTIPQNSQHKEFYMFNETNLLTSYPGVKGIKAGYTDEAGFCLVTYLDYEGHKIIAILLNSGNRRQEMKDLLDYSLKTLGVNPPRHL